MSGLTSEKSVHRQMTNPQKLKERLNFFLRPGGFLALTLFILAGCSSTYQSSPWGRSNFSGGGRQGPWGKTSPSEGDIFSHGQETGIASWYGPTFYGKRTASGAIFRKDALTGAHRTLPLGTHVRVENMENGKSVDVVINDRGPFVSGRIIDLSWKAANEIGMLGRGTAPVRLTVLNGSSGPSPEESLAEGKFEVQVGSFTSYDEAKTYLKKIHRYPDAHIVRSSYPGGTIYRVRIGRFQSVSRARDYARTLRSDLGEAFVVRQ